MPFFIRETLPSFFVRHLNNVYPGGVDKFLLSLKTEDEHEHFGEFLSEFNRAVAHEHEKQWVEARDIYGALAIEYPEWNVLAGAREIFILEEYVNRAISHHNTGVHHMRQGDYSAAVDEFLMALHLNPYLEQSRFDMGLAYKFIYVQDPVKNRSAKLLAREAFEVLLRQNPEHSKALWQMQILDKI